MANSGLDIFGIPVALQMIVALPVEIAILQQLRFDDLKAEIVAFAVIWQAPHPTALRFTLIGKGYTWQ